MRTEMNLTIGSEIQKWEQEHWEYMQSLPEKFDVLHYVTILDLEKI